jgi:hypothetical protein
MIGPLVRRIVIWPIPPRYSGPAVVTILLAASAVAVVGVHTFSGVLTALISAGVLVFAIRALCTAPRSP